MYNMQAKSQGFEIISKVFFLAIFFLNNQSIDQLHEVQELSQICCVLLQRMMGNDLNWNTNTNQLELHTI